MPLRRTGRTGQSSPSFWRAPRSATRRRADSTGASTGRDWIQISVTALPGVVALVALVFAWLSIRATNDQLQIAEQGQITDRYNAAITNLGSPSVDVRLGGIYALQRIMQDSPRDQPTVVAVLCAFVRDYVGAATTRSADSAAPRNTSPALGPPPTDVQAALTVVGTRNTADDGSTTVVDFSGAYLYGANLAGAHLSGADFSGADLSGANLTRTVLSGADLTAANLTAILPDADLSGADLFDANLKWANLSGADLTGADLTAANLSNANLNSADLSDARGSASLSDADLNRANLSGANLSGAIFSGAILYGANLTDADLSDANLAHAAFTRANLSGANLSYANLTDTGFSGADLTGAKGLRTDAPQPSTGSAPRGGASRLDSPE